MTATGVDWQERIREIEAEARDAAGRRGSDRAELRERTNPTRVAPEWQSNPWDAFRDSEDGELDWLVDDAIPAGSLVFVASAPKRGKTWLAIDLSVGVATGTSWLGHRIAVASPALYVGLEGARRALRARIGCLARGRGLVPEAEGALPNLRVSTRREVPDLDLMRAEWWDALRSEVEEHGARLVVVDVLRSAAPRLRETGEGAADFGLIRAGASRIQDLGVTVVLLHHFIKAAGADRLVGERMTGSGALYGALDVGIFITPSALGEQWDREIPVAFEARDFEPPSPATVRIEGDGKGANGSLRFLDSAQLVVLSAEQVAGKLERAIVDALGAYTDYDARASTKAVQQLVGGKATVVRNTLHLLHKQGLIEHGVGGIDGLPKNTKWWRHQTSSENGTRPDEVQDQLPTSPLVPPLGGDEG